MLSFKSVWFKEPLVFQVPARGLLKAASLVAKWFQFPAPYLSPIKIQPPPRSVCRQLAWLPLR